VADQIFILIQRLELAIPWITVFFLQLPKGLNNIQASWSRAILC